MLNPLRTSIGLVMGFLLNFLNTALSNGQAIQTSPAWGDSGSLAASATHQFRVLNPDPDHSQISRRRSPSAPTGRYTCPTELAPLTSLLVRDLPGYLNRLHVRMVRQKTGLRSYAIVASQPELKPLPASSEEYPDPQDDSLQQAFFTVLERQYTGDRVSELQAFHWLFLTQSQTGWKLALLYSHYGPFPLRPDAPLTPVEETSQGLTAAAIRLWLRDCQAGSIKP
jgi:hypothetical protein